MNRLLEILERYFVSPSSSPAFFQMIMTAFQFFLFTVLISSQMMQNSISPSSQTSNLVIVGLISFVLVRLATRISLIKFFYIVFTYYLAVCLDSKAILGFLFLGINLISDWLSKVQFSFSTSNIYSQKNAYFILFHYVGMIACIILKVNNLNSKVIFPVVSVLVFTILIFIKYNSIVKQQKIKEFYLRFYLLSIFYSLINLLSILIHFESGYKHLISIIFSQLLYQIAKYKFQRNFSIQEYLSKQLYEEVSFKLLCYIYSQQYNEKIEKAISNYIHDDGISLMTSQRNQQKKSLIKKQYLHSQDRKFLIVKLNQVLKQNQSVYSKIIRTQIILCQFNDYFSSKITLNKQNEKTPFYNFGLKILFCKMKYLFNEKINMQTSKITCPNFQEFVQNDKFRSILLRSSINWILLWEYTKVPQIIYSKLNKLVSKVIQSQQFVDQTYNNLKTKQIKVSLLYAQYLQKVARNIKKANELIQQVYFYQQNCLNIDIQQKVYISFDLEGDQPLVINNVGSNISKLLGFQRRILIGQKHHVFLPNFYRQAHLKQATSKLKQSIDEVFLYYKKTIVKNADNYYSQMLIVLKIGFNIQQKLILHGYLKMVNNQKYNWNNFLFVNSHNLEILQCSDQIRQKISNGQSKKYQAQDYFDYFQKNKLNKTQIATQEAIKYYYEPVKQFFCQETEIIMFVRIDPFYQSFEEENIQQKQVNKIKSNILLIPHLNFFEKIESNNQQLLVLKNKKKLDKNLIKYRKKSIILSIIIVLVIIFLFVSQGMIYEHARIQFYGKNQMLEIINKLVIHYNSLSKIALDLSYMQLEFNYNYTWADYKYSLQQSTNNIQSTNQYFKKYSIKEWPYQSLSSVQQYHNCYEFVAQITACASVISTIQDKTIKKNMVAAFNELFTQIFVWSYSQYSDSAIKQFGKDLNLRKITNFLLLFFFVLFCIICFALILKFQTTLRQSEFQSLQFVGNINFQNQMIQNSKNFISKISTQKLNKMDETPIKQNQKFYENFLKSGDMSSRQNTGRNLIDGLSTFRQTNTQQKTQTTFINKASIKLKDRNKLIVFLFAFLLLGILLTNLINMTINFYKNSLDATQSAKNVLSLMNKPLYFTRVVNAFMTEDKINVTDHDKTFYKSVSAFQNDSNNIASFQEMSLLDFSDFSQFLTQIRYEYMCNYIDCPQKYYDYINLLYATTMQKQVNLMISNPYLSFFSTNNMQVILVSEALFRQIMSQLLQMYFSDYAKYAKRILQTQTILFYSVIGFLTGICFCTLIIGYIFVWKQIIKFQKISNLIKYQSYLYLNQNLDDQQDQNNEKFVNKNNKIQNQELKKQNDKSKIQNSFDKQINVVSTKK